VFVAFTLYLHSLIFSGMAGTYPSEAPYGRPLKPLTDTLAYYGAKLITAVKSFLVPAPVAVFKTLNFLECAQ
jgi:hypothetical protein